MVLSSARNG